MIPVHFTGDTGKHYQAAYRALPDPQPDAE